MVLKMSKESGKTGTGRRIKILREDILGMTQQEFAACFDGEFSRGALGNWERGEGVKLSNLRAIAQKFGVDLNWLTTGAGEPPRQKFSHDETIKKFNNTYVKVLDDGLSLGKGAAHREVTPVADLTPRAAHPGFLQELDLTRAGGDFGLGERTIMGDLGFKVSADWTLSQDFVEKEARVRRNDSVILSIVGDSMFPSYASGDRVIIDLSQRELIQDAVYAITDGQIAPQIKRLQRVFKSDPPRVRIISDNTHYAAEEHPLADVEIIGRVCGIIARR